MAYAIVWTTTAAEDIRAIAAYVAIENADAAANLISRILRRIDAAAMFPHAQREVPEIGNKNTRESILSPSRVVYAINDSTEAITILRIWHSARGVPELGTG